MSATEYGIIVKDQKFYCDGNPFDTFSEAMEYRRSRELTEKKVETAISNLMLHHHADSQNEALEIVSIVLSCMKGACV